MNYDNDPHSYEPSGLTPAQWLIVQIATRATVCIALALGAALAICMWLPR